MHEAPYSHRHDRLVDERATSTEKTYATVMHLSILLFHIAVPVILALVMWLIKRDESPYINDHGKEAVNFQISLVVYSLLGLALTPMCGIGFAVWVAVYVLGAIGCVFASLAAHRGEYYRYPACLRFIA
jgi:uncharacterized Tic20 family protein